MFHHFHVSPNPPSFLYPLLPLSPYQLNSHCSVVSNSNISVLGFSRFFLLFYRVLTLTIKKNANTPVMCAVRHSLSRGNWRDISAYIVGSSGLAAKCVISHSLSRANSRNIYAYIVGSGHFAVICVISHSLSRAIWGNICRYTVANGHFAASCVISHSVRRIILRHIDAYIVGSLTVLLYPLRVLTFLPRVL
jgi:hypothetical protein